MTTNRPIDPDGVRGAIGGYAHAMVVSGGSALTVMVADHWDERWLVEIEAIAARVISATPLPSDSTS